jgi:hypothetical protein
MSPSRLRDIGLSVLGVMVSMALTGPPPARADVTLVKDGKAVAKIYADAPTSLSTEEVKAPQKKAKRGESRPVPAEEDLLKAITDLNDHLQKMSGASLEVVRTDNPKDVTGPAVVLGELALKLGAVPQKKSESKEGFRLLAKDDRLLVGGESSAGTRFGVYEVLYRLGCDWVMPGEIGEIIPRKSTVSLAPVDESQAPDFLMRRLWYRGYRTKEHPAKPGEAERFAQWSERQKAGNYAHVVQGTGGHIWDQFIKRHKAEFDKDPTMLALVKMPDGTMQRRGPQLESTHPRVIALFVQDIQETYKKNIAEGKWTKETPAGFGIGPADGLGYSMSPESLKAGSGQMDPIVGELDRTDELILLGNRILEEVHKEYPNAYVGFYSYSTHAGFPAKFVPDPKIGVIFAPINFSRFHSVLDPNSRTQPYYRKVVEQWGELSRKQGNLLTYRGYNWNLAENILPYTKVRIWGEELPFYKQQRLIGMNVEATKMWSVLGPSDYVFMRLCWNSSLDWKQLLREYCVKAYGKGAAAMERYNLELAQRQSDAKQEAGSFNAYHLMYDNAWVSNAKKTIDEATAAADTPNDKARIGFVAHTVEALRLYLAFHDAVMAFDFPAIKAGYDAMASHWQKAYDLNSDLVANEGPAYLKRYLLQFVDEGLKYSSNPYKMILRLPDEMSMQFDKDEVGHLKHYAEAGFNDSAWPKTRTYSSTWDAQNLTAGHRSGAVWYRHRFSLPSDVQGQPVGLFLGGFEDEARVWLNGKLIGTSGRRFSMPAVYDLTDEAKAGTENVLAIMVVRNSAANEIGLGGILRPCFVFTGPRLEQKAPGKTLELKQVLPGGDLGG